MARNTHPRPDDYPVDAAENEGMPPQSDETPVAPGESDKARGGAFRRAVAAIRAMFRRRP